MENITAIILTKNEELNIDRCIQSLQGRITEIVIVDSFSTDNTCILAQKYNARIYQHKFENYALQFNWAVNNTDITTDWVLRLDADEQLTTELLNEILEKIKIHNNDDVNAMIIKYRVFFMNKFLKHGGVYPFKKISVYKKNKAEFEERPFGEHVYLKKGKTIELKNDCNHHDFKDINTFIAKHNWYASREACDYYYRKNILQKNLYGEAQKARYLRDGLYYKLPKFIRAKLLYIYKYYIRLGFLDGIEGKIYALLQSYIYRLMVDVKIIECEKYGNIYEETGDLKN